MSDQKASGLRLPSKIGRPCCTVQPKPAVPSSPLQSSMNPMEPIYENSNSKTDDLRRASDTSVVLTEDTDSFIIGNRVWVGGTKPGSIAYIGETQFAPGDWAGVVLDEPIGKNDGSVAGSRYFQCAPKHGIFSRLTRLTRHPLSDATTPMSPSEKTLPNNNNNNNNSSKSMSTLLNASTTSLSSSISQIRDLKTGDRVIVSSSQGSKTGILRFIGTTEFAPGDWCGVELDDPVGKNDGSVAGIRFRMTHNHEYFECQPQHGLFAPLHKVSRSPSSKRPSSCVVHKPSGAALNSSLRKMGSRDSLTSLSSMTSAISTSSIRGVPTPRRTRQPTPAQSSLQEMLKEKQQEIEMLRRERDLERERMTKAATQADDAEQLIITLKREYDKHREDLEKTVLDAQTALAQLFEEKSMLNSQLEEEKHKCEDLLFRLEEESINKEDIQIVNNINGNKIQELESQLSKERERVIQLEEDNTKLFEVEEELVKLRSEKGNLSELENTNLCLKEAKITLENQMLERKNEVEELKNKLKKFEDEYSKTRESSEKEHQISSATMKQEIEELKKTIENLRMESAEENDVILTKLKTIIQEKNDEIENRNKEINSGNLKLSDLSEELKIKDQEIQEKSKHLHEHASEIEKLKEELESRRSASSEVEKAHTNAQQIIENLQTQLKTFVTDNSELKEKLGSMIIQMEDEKNTILSENLKLQNSIDSLETLNNNLKAKESELEKINEEKEAEIEELKKNFQLNLDDKLKKIDETTNEITIKTLKLNSVEQELAALKTQMTQKNEEMGILLERTTELEDAFTFSEQTKTNLESELKIYENNIKDLNKKLAFSEENVGHLNAEKTRLESEISSVISSSVGSSEQLMEYNEKLRSKDKEISLLRDQKFELDTLIKEAETELTTKKEKIESSSKEIESLKTEIITEKENSAKVEKNLNKIENDFSELKLKSQEMSESYKTTISELNDRINVLQEESCTFTNSQQKLESEKVLSQKLADEYLLKINDMSAESSILEERIKALIEEKEESSVQYSTLISQFKTELDDVKEKYERSQTANEKLKESVSSLEASVMSLEAKLRISADQVKSYDEKLSTIESSDSDKTLIVEQLKNKLDEQIKVKVELTEKLISSEKENKLLANKIEVGQEANDKLRDSISSMEKSILNLESHLKDSMNKVELYEKECHNLKISDSEKGVFVEEMKKKLENQSKTEQELDESLRLIRSENESLNNEIQSKSKMVEDLGNLVETLRQEEKTLKTSLNATALEKEGNQQELEKIRQELSSMKSEHQQLQNIVSELKENCSSHVVTIQNLTKQLEVDRTERDELKNDEIRMKSEIGLINAQNEELKGSIIILEKVVKDMENKREENPIQIRNIDRETTELRENHFKPEKENQHINVELQARCELGNKNNNEETSIRSDSQVDTKRILEENETYKGQIDFLNSVIVEMQRKNEKLLCKVQVLETGVPATEADDYSRSTLDKKAAAPRMFCDICDQFDLHETEDCPKQSQDFEVEKQMKTSSKVRVDRAYCENCEMFGHDTADCDDAETF